MIQKCQRHLSSIFHYAHGSIHRQSNLLYNYQAKNPSSQWNDREGEESVGGESLRAKIKKQFNQIDENMVKQVLSFGPTRPSTKRGKVHDHHRRRKLQKRFANRDYFENDCQPMVNDLFKLARMKKLTVANSKESLPPINLAHMKKKSFPKEIVFIGRSNVGKSSLLNSICSRGLQEVSDKPGKTVDLSFYALKEFLTVVDVPGYGFAYYNRESVINAMKEGQDTSSIETEKEIWLNAIEHYLDTDKGNGKHRIAHAYILLDARHGIKKADVPYIHILHKHHIPYSFVLTKTDICFPEEIVQTLTLMREQMISLGYFDFDYKKTLMTSSRSKSGIGAIRGHIATQVSLADQIRTKELNKQKEVVDKKLKLKHFNMDMFDKESL